MASILDYMMWRGDVPLAVDPLNEVDGLLLSILAYIDFHGAVPQGGAETDMEEACAAFFRSHSAQEAAKSRSFAMRAPLLMPKMATDARFRGTKLRDYIDIKDQDKSVQLSAVTMRLPDGGAFIAFRGTDGTLVGWKEDFNFSYLSQTEGQNLAVQYLNRVGAALSGPLRVGGHSKGGNLAVYAAAFCDIKVQDRIQTVYCNDGPGFRTETVEAEGYQRILPRIRSVIPDSSVVGLLLNSKAEPRVVKSSASGISQHDGFTWQVQRNKFETAPLSAESEMIQSVLGEWLEKMDDGEREQLIETVFSLFESTGKDTFSDIGGQNWKSAEQIITSARDMPKEQQQKVLASLGKLAQSGGSAAAQYVLNWIRKNTPER